MSQQSNGKISVSCRTKEFYFMTFDLAGIPLSQSEIFEKPLACISEAIEIANHRGLDLEIRFPVQYLPKHLLDRINQKMTFNGQVYRPKADLAKSSYFHQRPDKNFYNNEAINPDTED